MPRKAGPPAPRKRVKKKRRRFPAEAAFELWVSLGEKRNYQKVADHFRVALGTVQRHATTEKWRDRLAKIQHRAKKKTDTRLTESVTEMNRRQIAAAGRARCERDGYANEFRLATVLDHLDARLAPASPER